MATRMPTEITVGPFVYRVTSAWDDYTQLGEDPDCYGHTNHKSLVITINPRLAYASMAETLWHEIKHVVCRVIGFTDGNEMKEELWVNATASMEWAALRANPDLVAFLLYRETD